MGHEDSRVRVSTEEREEPASEQKPQKPQKKERTPQNFENDPAVSGIQARPRLKVADKTLPPVGGLWKHEKLVSKTVECNQRKT